MASDIDDDEARRTLAARREHDEGDGNFPTPQASRVPSEERERDRTPKDLPKERDPRNAPKPAGDTAGQRDRNPDLEMRDDDRPRRA
jgi:hypothetical protein